MFLEYKGININYTDQGKGNVVVLLHGFLENSNMWLPFLPHLTKKHRVICIDLLGHGKTECLGYLHTMELMAEAVEAVLEHLKITRSTIIGHSMGGYVALAFAEKKPEALLGLCLMNSTAESDSQERKKNRDRAIAAVKENHKTFIRLAVVNLFRPKNRSIYSDRIKEIKKEALQTPLQGIIAALQGMKLRKSKAKLLTGTPYKKLIMISKKDPVLDYNSLINQTKNTDTKIVVFPDGHMSHIENESAFLYELMHFIDYL